MPRVLVCDDSVHAQRMGSALLEAEGCETVAVSDGLTAMVRMADVDPDLVLLDWDSPQRSGYDVAEFVKRHPRHGHVKVVLLAGAVERVDAERAQVVGVDAVLRKPLEQGEFRRVIRPLLDQASVDRAALGWADERELRQAAGAAGVIRVRRPDTMEAERVRAAVTIALDAALPGMSEEITNRVLIALGLAGNPAQRNLFE
jgi:CheY-like chemotaxis protein